MTRNPRWDSSVGYRLLTSITENPRSSIYCPPHSSFITDPVCRCKVGYEATDTVCGKEQTRRSFASSQISRFSQFQNLNSFIPTTIPMLCKNRESYWMIVFSCLAMAQNYHPMDNIVYVNLPHIQWISTHIAVRDLHWDHLKSLSLWPSGFRINQFTSDAKNENTTCPDHSFVQSSVWWVFLASND